MQKTFRIVIMVVLLLFSFSFCAAAQERWERVPISVPSLEVFIDKRSLMFETDNNRYSKTYNHKFVTAWVAYDDYQKNITMQTYAKYNLTNSSYKLLAAYKYTLDGEVIETGVGVVLRKKVSKLGELFIFGSRKKNKPTNEGISEGQ